MEVTFTMNGVESLKEYAADLQYKATEGLEYRFRLVAAAAEFKYLQELRDRAPEKTGELKFMFFIEQIGSYHWIRLQPRNWSKHAEWVMFGTKAHIIRPRPWAKKKPQLWFVWKGKLVHFDFVHHPGIKENRFDKEAASATIKSKEVRAAINEIRKHILPV